MLFQKCKCINVLLLWAKFHWKIPLGKWFFKFWPKMTRNKNRVFGRHFETVQHFQFFFFFFFFFAELWFFIVHIYMVQISLQNCSGKVVLYGWVPRNPPWAPTGVKVPWSLKCKERNVTMTEWFSKHSRCWAGLYVYAGRYIDRQFKISFPCVCGNTNGRLMWVVRGRIR